MPSSGYLLCLVYGRGRVHQFRQRLLTARGLRNFFVCSATGERTSDRDKYKVSVDEKLRPNVAFFKII